MTSQQQEPIHKLHVTCQAGGGDTDRQGGSSSYTHQWSHLSLGCSHLMKANQAVDHCRGDTATRGGSTSKINYNT